LLISVELFNFSRDNLPGEKVFALGTPVANMLVSFDSWFAAIVRVDLVDLPSGTLALGAMRLG